MGGCESSMHAAAIVALCADVDVALIVVAWRKAETVEEELARLRRLVAVRV